MEIKKLCTFCMSVPYYLTGLTNREIGKIFKMKAQAVSKAGIKIERG
jgi:hypothetical protein